MINNKSTNQAMIRNTAALVLLVITAIVSGGCAQLTNSTAPKPAANDDEKQHGTVNSSMQEVNMMATLAAFERNAQQILGDKAATAKQKREAQQFVRDLQTYNSALPDGEKILGADGRLINFGRASKEQKRHLQNIVLNQVDAGNQANAGVNGGD